MSKFKPIQDSQLYLLPPSVEDFIPESHLARVVSEVVEAMDVSTVESKYSEMGQKSYHPRILLKLLFYGYCIGVRSGRKIASACESDTAFMFLASMYRPDFRTLNDFRKDNISFVEKAFVQVIQMCRALGMGQAGTLIIDGTKLRANANANNNKSKADYEQWLAKTEAEIHHILQQAAQTDDDEDAIYGEQRGDELPEELRSKEKLRKKIHETLERMREDEKVNSTDVDAKYIRSDGKINLNYNCQTAITEDGLITGAYTSNNASDRPQTIPLIEQAERNTNQSFDNILADSGYASYDNYEALEKLNKTIYIPDQEKENDSRKATNPYHRSHFTYEEKQNRYLCPEGKPLAFSSRTVNIRSKQKSNVYIGTQCVPCPVKSQCTKGNIRHLHIEFREPLRQKIRERLNSEDGKRIYRKRWRIESIFGNIKHNLNFTKLLLRGIEKTTAEWQLICLAHNIKKMYQIKAT